MIPCRWVKIFVRNIFIKGSIDGIAVLCDVDLEGSDIFKCLENQEMHQQDQVCIRGTRKESPSSS